RARRRLGRPGLGRAGRRALTSYLVLLAVWQLGATSARWLGHPLPVLGKVPTPAAVLATGAQLLVDPGFWHSWAMSLLRVLGGFSAAALIGIPFGLLLALSPVCRGAVFPVFELL